MRRLFKPRSLLLTLALLLAGLVVLAIWLTKSENITESKFKQIELGMTKEQVETILNQVAPNYVWETPSRRWLVYSEDAPDRMPPGATVWIEWDQAANKAVAKGYIPPSVPDVWAHLVNRLNTFFGRNPPSPLGSPFIPPDIFVPPDIVDPPNQ